MLDSTTRFLSPPVRFLGQKKTNASAQRPTPRQKPSLLSRATLSHFGRPNVGAINNKRELDKIAVEVRDAKHRAEHTAGAEKVMAELSGETPNEDLIAVNRNEAEVLQSKLVSIEARKKELRKERWKKVGALLGRILDSLKVWK